ncbi:hypothetical protein AB5J55_33035 [Streptomyces sp. R11]|uniref:Transposase n=1 Tax=Streptomyces sp. R11 TaxID=3238625 RepID=A0AB39N6J3_9ACTN
MTLIRELDAIVMDQSRLRRPDAPRVLTTAPLGALAHDFEELGDRTQALRAQRLHTALQEKAWDGVSARLNQAVWIVRTVNWRKLYRRWRRCGRSWQPPETTPCVTGKA